MPTCSRPKTVRALIPLSLPAGSLEHPTSQLYCSVVGW